MEYQIICSSGEKATLVIDDAMTVDEVRGVVSAMMNLRDDVVTTISLNGTALTTDTEQWGSLVRRTDPRGLMTALHRKIFCNISQRPKTELQSGEAMRAMLSKDEIKAEESKERQRARQMESLIDSMVKMPGFFDAMVSMNPEAKAMMEKNPSVAQQMNNPALLKSMMMAQIDPDRRREMERSFDLQMAQISAMPGGQQMINQYMHTLMEDMQECEGAAGQRETDSSATAEESCRPDPSREANSDALPNPWAPNQSQQPQRPLGSFFNSHGPEVPPSMPASLFGGLPFLANGGTLNHSALPSSSSGAGGILPSGGLADGFFNPSGAGGLNLMQLMNQMASPTPQREPSHPPVEASTGRDAVAPRTDTSSATFEDGMAVLRDMGFEDDALCREALTRCSGNVEDAVEYIGEHQK